MNLRLKWWRDFYGNLGTWAVVNTILVIVWVLSGRGYPWFLWPLCIWGAFALLHCVQVYVFKSKSDSSAIENKRLNMQKSASNNLEALLLNSKKYRQVPENDARVER
ncbi:2TM domain-containing protein [Chloroflexota bacterium]